MVWTTMPGRQPHWADHGADRWRRDAPAGRPLNGGRHRIPQTPAAFHNRFYIPGIPAEGCGCAQTQEIKKLKPIMACKLQPATAMKNRIVAIYYLFKR